MPTCLTSGICNISRSNRNSTRQLEVHSNIYSCGYRGQYGCPRLRCWSLIGRGSGSCLYFTEPIGSHASGSSICWILDRESERKSPKKFRTPKSFGQRNRTAERGHRISFDDTEKLFRDTPLSQIGFGTCLIILGGCQNHSGSFLEFSEIKTGNVPELPEPLQMRFADENH